MIPDRAPPALRVLSLQLAVVTKAESNQTFINAAAVSVYDSINSENATDIRHQHPVQGCSVRFYNFYNFYNFYFSNV